MRTYIIAFIFYTLAMIGVLFAAFVIYKKTMITTQGRKKGSMKILESLPIGPKKMLLVIKVEGKKLLIASDMDRTSFLADLTEGKNINEIQKEETMIPVEKFENDTITNSEKQESSHLLEGSSRKKMIRKILQNLKGTDYGNRSIF